jgi:hypothetical protein
MYRYIAEALFYLNSKVGLVPLMINIKKKKSTLPSSNGLFAVESLFVDPQRQCQAHTVARTGPEPA